MNIFGVGGPELVMIFLIMLIVAGPKRMIRWAYVVGQYVGKFRILWEQMVDMVQKEVDEAGIDVQIPREIPTRQNIGKYAGDMMKPFVEPMEETLKEVQQPLKQSMDDVNQTLQETKNDASNALKSAKQDVDNATRTPTRTRNQDSGAIAQGTSPEPSAPETDNTLADDTSTDSSFGAWGNPQPPSQQVGQEA